MLLLLVWVHLDVLVGDASLFKRDPRPLDIWAELPDASKPQRAERHGAHVVPFHNFPASLMDHVVNLTSRPVARGPPPNNVDVDALAHAGRRLDSLGSLEMYSQVLRNFQSIRRSANPLQPTAPPPAPAAPIATASTQSNPALTAIAPTASVDSNTPQPVPVTREDPSVGSPSTTNGGPPSASHNPMEELD